MTTATTEAMHFQSVSTRWNGPPWPPPVRAVDRRAPSSPIAWALWLAVMVTLVAANLALFNRIVGLELAMDAPPAAADASGLRPSL